MSVGRFLQQGAAGNAGGAGVYVDDVFSTYLYEGTGTSFSGPGQTITNGIDLAGEGGMVWLKTRDSAQHNLVIDTERGGENHLITNSTNAAGTDTGYHISSFNSDGFSLQANGTGSNNSSYDYVSWTFRKQPKFFDVVTWTGDGVSGRAISHSLGSVPGMIIIKRRSGSDNWNVWHRSLSDPQTKRLFLNYSLAEQPQSTPVGQFGGQDPTSTEFYVGPQTDVNSNGQTYVAYLFAHDAQNFGTDSNESIIKCGTYTGNGSATGVEVNLGFEPQWLLVKTASGSGSHKNWWLLDNMRGIPTGSNEALLAANLSDAETGNADIYDLTATGFIPKNSAQANQNGMNYIYVAIRRPHKPAEEFAATDLFGIDLTSAGTPAYDPGFTTDFIYQRAYASTQNNFFMSRLTGSKYLLTESTNQEATGSSITWDYQTGAIDNFGASNYAGWCFRRAPGFFDIVTYTGEIGASGTGHNLGVTPEFIIVKRRDGTSNWRVWHKDLGTNESLVLNGPQAIQTGGSYFSNPPADADKIYPGGAGEVNTLGVPYITYLFATVPGISKVGSYSGTGSDVDVNCGFTSGARFVLVKRTDSTGDWYVWDSERGIVAGNDPYLLLNSTAAHVTSTDYIDPLSSGFTITSSAPAALNASGGNYIFLAIA